MNELINKNEDKSISNDSIYKSIDLTDNELQLLQSRLSTIENLIGEIAPSNHSKDPNFEPLIVSFQILADILKSELELLEDHSDSIILFTSLRDALSLLPSPPSKNQKTNNASKGTRAVSFITSALRRVRKYLNDDDTINIGRELLNTISEDSKMTGVRDSLNNILSQGLKPHIDDFVFYINHPEGDLPSSSLLRPSHINEEWTSVLKREVEGYISHLPRIPVLPDDGSNIEIRKFLERELFSAKSTICLVREDLDSVLLYCSPDSTPDKYVDKLARTMYSGLVPERWTQLVYANSSLLSRVDIWIRELSNKVTNLERILHNKDWLSQSIRLGDFFDPFEFQLAAKRHMKDFLPESSSKSNSTLEWVYDHSTSTHKNTDTPSNISIEITDISIIDKTHHLHVPQSTRHSHCQSIHIVLNYVSTEPRHITLPIYSYDRSVLFAVVSQV